MDLFENGRYSPNGLSMGNTVINIDKLQDLGR